MRGLATAFMLGVALLLGAAAPAPQTSPPAGWRAPTPREVARIQRQANAAAGQPVKQRLAIRADFDGDGRPDRAMFLINDRTRMFALFVVRARTGRYQRLDYADEVSRLRNYGLNVERPQVFTTICGQGLREPGERCRERVRARWPAIGAECFETAYQVFFWDGRRFDTEFLSD